MVLTREEAHLRKDRVLAITIDQYIRSVSPVSSSYISKQAALDLSSATIRNILAELEHDGYLTHPHTSAGRIPTEKGYRYYVDHLMHEIQLLEEEKAKIKSEYEFASKQLEVLLEQSSHVLSNLTHYTSIISIDGIEDKLFFKGTNYLVDHVDINNIKKIGHILAALEQKENILKIINRELEDRINILIGEEVALNNVDECSMVITRFKSREGTSGRIAILGPTRMNYQRVVSTVNYFSKLIEEML